MADLSDTHAQYLHSKRSILRAERTKKSLVRNSRVLSVQVHNTHTQQVMTFTPEMCNKPLAQTYMLGCKSAVLAMRKSWYCSAIAPLLHTNSAAIAHPKRRYWKTRASFLRQNTTKTAWQLSRIKILFVIHFYCLYDICITCKHHERDGTGENEKRLTV